MHQPYFPYPSYRLHQQEMLDAACRAVSAGQILLVDAPTGSGKSSLICSLLGAAGNKKIIVAVRSNSQLDIFLNELTKIRTEKIPGLKFSYIYGKNKICPLFSGTKDNVYTKCDGVRKNTDRLFAAMYAKHAENAGRNEKEGTNPLEWSEYKEAIKKQTESGKITICPYYANILASLAGNHQNNVTVEDKINELLSMVIRPEKIAEFSGGYCPHKLLWDSLKNARVVVLNYHYLLRREIESTLLSNLEREPRDVCLLLDEAHNVGEIVKSIYGETLSERTLDTAEGDLKELAASEKYGPGLDALKRICSVLRQAFDARRFDSPQSRMENPLPVWLNPDDMNTGAFLSHMSEGGEWSGFIDKLLDAGSPLIEQLMEERDYAEFALYRVYMFVMGLSQIREGEPYFVYLKKDRDSDKVTFEKRVLDPGEHITEFVHQYHSAVLCSGTLFPLEEYKRYYFNTSERVVLHSVPNSFPANNRLVLRCTDYSSAYALRNLPENFNRGAEYVRMLCRVPGNVAVFFTSYSMRNRFLMETHEYVSKFKKIFSEPQGDDEKARELIREFMALPGEGGAGILFGVCGAKWFEGLDFKGDLLNAVLVLGLPLGVLDSYQKRVIAWFSAKFGKAEGEFIGYYLPAMNKAVQALGRCLRTDSDTGVLVLGDLRYSNMLYRRGLPVWMASEMRGVCAGEFGDVVDEAVGRWRGEKRGV